MKNGRPFRKVLIPYRLLYTRRLRRLEENESRLKKQLLEILHRVRDPCIPEQTAAKAVCVEVLNLLKSSEPDFLHSSDSGRYPLAYLNELSELWLALQRHSWTGACDALIDLIYFNSITQAAIRSSTISALEKFLN